MFWPLHTFKITVQYAFLTVRLNIVCGIFRLVHLCLIKTITMKLLYQLLLLVLPAIGMAQQDIAGKITDPKGKPVAGANVFIDGTYDGATTDAEGSFSFQTTATGEQQLKVTALTFDAYSESITVESYTAHTIKMRESVNALDAVVISAGTFESGDKARVSVLKPLDIVTTAGSSGDIVAALQTLPGTQVVGEDGRLFVRGGEADETQTFVDGIRVAQPYGPTANNLPTRGRFSPFLFSGIAFSTGGYSAEYGEALSSVLLLNTTDEPDQEKTDISLMTVGLGIGNTQKWGKSSLSVNLSYINLTPYQAAVPQAVDWNKPYQGLAGEAVYRYKTDNGIFKFYAAFDASELDLNQEDANQPEKVRFDMNNTNLYMNTSYTGFIGDHWTMTAGAGYGYSKNDIAINSDQVDNSENAAHLKFKIKRALNSIFRITAGADYYIADFEESYTPFSAAEYASGYNAAIAAAFIEADILVSKRFAGKVGLRASDNHYLHEQSLSPRASLAYKVSKDSQFSFAYGEFLQAPRQEFLKHSNVMDSEKASHYILNYQYFKGGRTLRAEGYYKQYDDLVMFEGAAVTPNIAFNNNGRGYAKGLDIFWRDNKSVRFMEYWLSYSFIDSEREYRNFPKQVTPSFVAKHTASLVTKYWFNDLKSQVGFTNTFSSGRPYNNPNQGHFMGSKTKAYNSLSFNWAYLLSQQKILYFSVSNVLGTDNVFGYNYSNTPGMDGIFARQAVRQPADRFFFVGFFWTISQDKKSNQLDSL
jgi:outer membrane cobalamin receptor